MRKTFHLIFFVWPMLRYIPREICAVSSQGRKHARGTDCLLCRQEVTTAGAYAELYSCLLGKQVSRCKTLDASKLLVQRKVEKFIVEGASIRLKEKRSMRTWRISILR